MGPVLLLLAALAVGEGAAKAAERVASVSCSTNYDDGDSIYNYTALDIYGERNISLSKFRGKFGLLEPGANATEILNGLAYVRPGGGFRPNFQMFAKTDVNGDHEHPLFTFLKSRCPSTRTGFSDKHTLDYDRFLQSDIRWNFEKFLVSRDGQPVKRYDSSSEPLSFQDHIASLNQTAPSVSSNPHTDNALSL